MSEFIITNVEHRVEAGNFNHSIQHHQTFELTLRPRFADETMMRKIMNISQAGRTVTLNDTEYVDFIEPFKNEFIDFMMDKHPEKIIADPKAWDRLLGRS